MNKIKQYFTIFLFFLLFYTLFKYNFILEKSVNDAFNLWISKVFPSLFLIFILNDIIINLNILDQISKPFNKLFNFIFKTHNQSGNAFLLSLLSSTPTSTYVIKTMTEQNKISIDDANKLIRFTYFSNPLFLYNILSLSFNKYIVFKIILIHYLSNVIIGLIYRNINSNNVNINSNNFSKNNILTILPTSIKNSINTLLMILGTITFYMIITNLLTNILNLNILNSTNIKGILEITQCLNILNKIPFKSIIKEIIAISIISFGGLSIHTQVLSIVNDTDIKYMNFLNGRLLHVLISTSTYIMIRYISI